ncbi:MAG: acyl-CoA synthetase FdrA [Candidatus Eisenbacteria bacterium]
MFVATGIRRGAYFDSVTLMKVGRELSGMSGVDDAAVVMGTAENRSILEASGLMSGELVHAADTDLLIAVRADTEESANAALATVDGMLESVRGAGAGAGSYTPRSLGGALDLVPDANLALISVAGRYAGDVAFEALDRGLNVMLFSDNVDLDTEIALKSRAHERGLLVMGPDCGTAIVNGVPLGFANAVTRGPVGIVAASGTGLQEVSSLLSNDGVGISQALGTGSRDVTREVGGVTFLDALRALGDDEDTEVVVLVSKPPDPGVYRAIREAADGIGKPVVSVFLGMEPAGELDSATLAGAAARAAAVVRGEAPGPAKGTPDGAGAKIRDLAAGLASAPGAGRKHVRALMSGGTFASEAVVVFSELGLPDVHANVSSGDAAPLDDALRSAGNCVVDMGADAFTVGRPHPMIDYSLRRKRLGDESRDPETAVILLDVVLGFGAHPDPASELEDAVRDAAQRVAVVCSVTGTERDPQIRSSVVEALAGAGATVMPSNESACRLAGEIVLALLDAR